MTILPLLENCVSSLSRQEDGISISNKIANLIIGEDYWTIEVFKAVY